LSPPGIFIPGGEDRADLEPAPHKTTGDPFILPPENEVADPEFPRTWKQLENFFA
jgi:hypothetical protein